jgi:general secretion pathway protein D
MVSTITKVRSRSLSLWAQLNRRQIRQLVRWVPAMGLSALLTVSSAQVGAETYKLNFKDAEVQELIKFVADATGLTFVVDPKVRGKIKVISTEAVDEKQLYDLFLSILEIHGFAAVRQGNVVRVVPDRTARSMPVPVSAATSKQDNAEYVTQVIQLDNVNAAKLIPILRPLVPQQAHMAAYADSNAIILSDTAANIARIKELIERIDRNSLQETELVKLEHAAAEETVRILEKLVQTMPGMDKSMPTQKSVQMVADKRTNSILLTGDPLSRARIRGLLKHLDSPLEAAGNAKVVFLRYAKAKDLSQVLTKVVQNMAKLDAEKTPEKRAAGATATIEADEATNSVIVTADADVMASLDGIIKRLDIPRAQVLVEAIIVEIEDTDGRDLGIEWFAVNKSGGFGGHMENNVGLLGGLANSATEEDPADGLEALATAIGKADPKGAIYGVGKFNEDGTSVAAVLNALQAQGKANVLSTPSIMTLDNTEASIMVGQEVPFVTGSYTSASTGGGAAAGGAASAIGNPFQTINRENVGITLKVTPHINEGDNLVLELEQEVSGVTPSPVAGASDLVTNERKIETSVLTGNGETVVLGGLIEDKVQEKVSKVPLLGDIPVLGYLFKTTHAEKKKTNLMVFIKPTIIRDAKTMETVSSNKYKSSRDAQALHRENGIELFRDEIVPVLPEWEQQIRQIDTIRLDAKSQQGTQPTQ